MVSRWFFLGLAASDVSLVRKLCRFVAPVGFCLLNSKVAGRQTDPEAKAAGTEAREARRPGRAKAAAFYIFL